VAFQITLPEGPETKALNEYYNRKDADFIYELTRAFTSPLTGFSRIIEGGNVIGFTISRYIYPFITTSLSKTSIVPSKPLSVKARSASPS